MNRISEFLSDNQGLLFGAATAALVGYLAVRDNYWGAKPKPKQNLLEITLPQLLRSSRKPNILKVVVTSSPASKGASRRRLINLTKELLTEQQVKVLINCSPHKLLKAGCECFLESMEPNDAEYIQYYYNALKTQLLIEDTIANIELIHPTAQNQNIVMVCDNNSLDIKLMNESEALWTQFLKKYQLKEEEIIQSYDYVIHLIEDDSDPAQDERIARAWGKFERYRQVKLQQGNLNSGCSEIVKEILRLVRPS